MGSKLKALPPAPGRKKFAPLNGEIRASGEWGANPGPGSRPKRGAAGTGKKFAPLDGGIRAGEERGANPVPFRRHRAEKSLLSWTEE